MKKIIYVILLCFMMQITQFGVSAQNTAVYEGLTYYLDKAEAFAAAREQGKQVFLFWGSDDCGRCDRTKVNLADKSLTSLLEENYILWYCRTAATSTVNTKDSPDVADYLAHLDVGYPTVCIIDLYDTTVAHGLITRRVLSVNELLSMLTQRVDNDFIADNERQSISIYTTDNSLVIKNSIENETVSIYTTNGSLVEKFTKTELSIVRSLSGYPKGILFITSNFGWTQKVVIK